MVNKIKNLKSYRKALIIIIGVLIGIFGLAIMLLVSDKRSFKDLTLDISLESFPTSVNKAGEEVDLNWQSSNLKEENNISSVGFSNISKDVPNATITIIDFNNSLESLVKFISYSNEVRTSSKWPNYYSPENRYINTAAEFNLLDNNFIVCELGNENSCQRWDYIGTYGKSAVEVIYFGPYMGIDKHAFSLILEGLFKQLR